jgi:hypothetical protein
VLDVPGLLGRRVGDRSLRSRSAAWPARGVVHKRGRRMATPGDREGDGSEDRRHERSGEDQEEIAGGQAIVEQVADDDRCQDGRDPSDTDRQTHARAACPGE